MQIKDIGREFSFEIGLTDTAGRAGVLRCSTFQEEPRIESLQPPLLHVPLDLSPPGCMNPWRTIAINLSTVIPHFNTAACAVNGPRTAHTPSGDYACMNYLKIYANCRLRRVWLAQTPDESTNQAWEFGLFGIAVQNVYPLNCYQAIIRSHTTSTSIIMLVVAIVSIMSPAHVSKCPWSLEERQIITRCNSGN
ncbi:hypothetical protein OPQ81_010317 [Rhizoctonia solani]|nr:hypothetical protein OPQ81_010317 [Rhizoctonia solani]